jgi:hypothetical protein
MARTMQKLLCVIVFWLLAVQVTPALAHAQTQGACGTVCIKPLAQASVPKWSKLELEIALTRWAENPFDPKQLDVRVRFISPQGAEAVVPAYYDGRGERTMRARFTPTTEGEWRAQAFVAGAQTQTSPWVRFAVTKPRSGAHGFVRVDKRNPYYLAFDDGTPFFPIGLNLAWWRDDPIKDYERWLDALAANGGNAIRVWMGPQSFSIEWKDTPLGNYTARLNRADYLDKLFEMAEARGIYIQLCLLDYSQFSLNVYPLWHDNPYNAANGGPLARPRDFATDPTARELFKQRLRYIAARWAYSPNLMAWEWWNEVNFTEVVETPLLKMWTEEMTAALRAHDPYRHLTTTSYSIEGDAVIWNMPEIDVVQRHDYNAEDPKWYFPVDGGNGRFQQQTKLLPKPLVMGEWGATYTLEDMTGPDRFGVQFHNGLWAAPFTGMASSAMYWWWDTLIEPANLWPHFKGIASFMRSEDLALLKPTPAKPSVPGAVALALGNEDRALVWLRSRQYARAEVQYKHMMALSTGEATQATFRFDPKPLQGVTVALSGLRDGAYVVNWFDTVSGRQIGREDAASAGGVLTLRALPFNTDLVAKVIRR